jgi:transglutaminase-like putative cysteine protease
VSRIDRLRSFTALVPLLVLHAIVGRQPAISLGIGLLCLLPAVAPWRLRPGVLGQIVVGALGVIAAVVLGKLVPLSTAGYRGLLGPIAPVLATGGLLVVAARLWWRDPAGGERATVAAGFVALVGLGSAQPSGPLALPSAADIFSLYPALSLLYLLLAGRWLRGGGRPWALGQHRAAFGAILGAGLALGAGGSWLLPWVHGRIVRFLIDLSPRVGFQDGPLQLGSLEGLAQSDRVVARVFGFRGSPLLRGALYRDYGRGSWLGAPGDFPRPTEIDGPEPTKPVTLRLEQVDVPRFFLPLEARHVRLNTPRALVDAFGILAPIYGTHIEQVVYEPGPRDRYESAAPGGADLILPAAVRPRLSQLAGEWAKSATTPEEKMAAIEDHLVRSHPYSLHFERPPRRDPVVAFLDEEGASGHCEYFASAAALLGRAVGVPTRVVAGYRLSEWNAVGGYHVVRERNAHAWVEAYSPTRGWWSIDPSPRESLELGPIESPVWSAWIDALQVRGGEAASWMLDHPRETAGVLVPIVMVLLVREWWRGRSRSQARARSPFADPGVPLSCLPVLLSALAARGFVRAPSETLDQLAARVDEASPGDEGARLLRRYAALRYGGEGDLGDLVLAIARHAD